MPWIYAVVGLIIGLIAGVIISRLTTPQYKKQKNIQKELDTAKFALEQQRQELADHFAQSAELLDTLGKDYTKLYQHLAKTSAQLLPNVPEQDNPFTQKLTQRKPPVEENKTASVTPINEAPKDYANGATGLFNEPEKEIITEPNAVTAKVS